MGGRSKPHGLGLLSAQARCRRAELAPDITYIAEGGKNIYINDMQADGSGSIYLSDFYPSICFQ